MRLSLTLIAFASALTQCALAQTTTTTVVTRESSYPPVGLASTETMQVNLANLASNVTNGPAASCTGSVSFINAAGTTIGAATNFNVAENIVFSVSLPFTKSAISGVRGEVRVVIQTTTPTGKNSPPCSLQTSLETFDTTTGATHVYLTSGSETPVSTPGK